jgi:cytochrome P450
MVSAPLAPTPPSHWLLGHLKARRDDPLGLYLGSQRALGDVVRYRMGYLRVQQLTHPDHVRHVLTAPGDAYGKGDSWARTKPLIGEGLATSEGDLWRRQRRIAQPAFSHDRLTGLAATMTACTQALLDRWTAERGQTVPVFDDVRELALRIVLRCLFGADLGEGRDDRVGLLSESFTAAMEVTDRRLVSILPIGLVTTLPTRDNRTFRRSLAALDGVVSSLIAAREARPADQDDLLGALMGATVDELGVLDRRQLRDEVMTLLLAGFETTANALTWAFVLLDSAPDLAARLRAEVDSVLDGRVPTADDLSRLVYTRAVVEEVLRLRPPLWAVPRVANREDVVDGYRIPAGDLVVLLPYVTHRHRDFWEDPETFDPTRFLPEQRRAVSRWAYFPFGGGKRVCLGQHFALMEAQLVLSMVVSRLDLHRVDRVPAEDAYVTLRPTGHVPMRVDLR